MRVATYHGRSHLVGTADSDGSTVLDLALASDGQFGPDPRSVFDDWTAIQKWYEATLPDIDGRGLAVDHRALGPPSPDARQVFAIGLNYRDHAEESGLDYPESPVVFTKFVTSFTGPVGDLVLPSDTVDWEAELVAVIGSTAYRVSPDQASSHIAGFTVGQDFSDRALQLAGPAPQFSLGKSWPGFAPQGPWLVTTDDLGAEVDDLDITCTVNGEIVQQGSTRDLIFPVNELVSRLSHVTTLLPGDVLFTGTPKGVGAGRTPPKFLRDGDVVETTISGIGTLRQFCTTTN